MTKKPSNQSEDSSLKNKNNSLTSDIKAKENKFLKLKAIMKAIGLFSLIRTKKNNSKKNNKKDKE